MTLDTESFKQKEKKVFPWKLDSFKKDANNLTLSKIVKDFRNSVEEGIPLYSKLKRSLVIEFPNELQLNETYSLLVYFSTELLSAPSTTIDMEVSLGTEIDIVVQPRRGFKLEGNGEAHIKVKVTNEDKDLPVKFILKTTDIGPAQIYVTAFYQGEFLGRVALAPLIKSSKDFCKSSGYHYHA